MIKNIVLDMGKVSLGYEPIRVCRAFTDNEADADLLLNAVYGSPEWIMLDRGDFSEEEFISRTSERLPERLRNAARESFKVWHEYVLYPIEGMDTLIRGLKSRGKGIYLLSNAALRLHVYAERLPARECFDGIFVSADEHCLKPSAEIFTRFFDRFGLLPSECFFIDDREENIEGAKACGMDGVVFDGDVQALKRITDTL